jgi:uncharacterized protein (TIGR02996 family)
MNMNDETPFLRCIAAEPGNRDARLIYADWLEERGDARAELIRLEEEMNELTVWSDRYAALKPRRTALRQQTDSKWRETLGYVPKHRPMFQKLPERRAERWRLFEEFLEVWHRPLCHDDGSTDAALASLENRIGTKLPDALYEWYRLVGNLKNLNTRVGVLASPDILKIDRNRARLDFFLDNYLRDPKWCIRLEDIANSDPPVYSARTSELISLTISGLALFVTITDTCLVWRGESGYSFRGSKIPAPLLTRAVERLSACDESDFPAAQFDRETGYFEGQDIILIRGPNRIRGAARTKLAYERLDPILRVELQV